MFFTARQLDDLHRTNGHVTVPRGSRLTPLASDWLKAKRVELRFDDEPEAGTTEPAPQGGRPESACGCAAACCTNAYDNGSASAGVVPLFAPAAPSAAGPPPLAAGRAAVGGYRWWCDGPCGPAKAAVAALARETPLAPSPVAHDAGKLVAAIKDMAGAVRRSDIAGGVLLVRSGAAASVYANRCPSLRAVLGTCLDSVEQGVQLVAANVLVLEHPYLSLQQVRNLLARFVRARRAIPEQAAQALRELASCG